MDQNEEETVVITTSDYVKAYAILGTIGFAAGVGAFQIGKLGYELGREGVRYLKARKKTKTED